MTEPHTHPEDLFSSSTLPMDDSKPPPDRRWWCTNRRRYPATATALRALEQASATTGRVLRHRLVKESWVRYQICLDQFDMTLNDIKPPPADVHLERIDETIMDLLQSHWCRDRAQLVTAARFWEHGLRDGFIWREDGEPLCFVWLFLPEHNDLLARLPAWAGMFPPLPEGWAQLENVFTFPRGLRRRGGAATDFIHAVMYAARKRHFSGLITHIHEDNLLARRWAQRCGCKAFGTLARYHLDLPRLREHPWYLHDVGPVDPVPSLREMRSVRRRTVERKESTLPT